MDWREGSAQAREPVTVKARRNIFLPCLGFFPESLVEQAVGSSESELFWSLGATEFT